MRNNIDWYFLRKPFVLLVVAILICAALVFGGMQFESSKREAFSKSENNLRTTFSLYTNMVNDIDLLEQYTSKYSAYKSSGLIGGERRLSWIESLEATNAVLKLPTLSYSLLPQESFERGKLKLGRNVEVKSTPMELTMKVLHEEDLFALFEGLELSISSLFTVDSCSISLIGDVGGSFDTRRANLESKCVLRWISVDAK